MKRKPNSDCMFSHVVGAIKELGVGTALNAMGCGMLAKPPRSCTYDVFWYTEAYLHPISVPYCKEHLKQAWN